MKSLMANGRCMSPERSLWPIQSSQLIRVKWVVILIPMPLARSSRMQMTTLLMTTIFSVSRITSVTTRVISWPTRWTTQASGTTGSHRRAMRMVVRLPLLHTDCLMLQARLNMRMVQPIVWRPPREVLCSGRANTSTATSYQRPFTTLMKESPVIPAIQVSRAV